MIETLESPLRNKSLKYHVETWGCQMNVADSEEMISLLERSEFQQARDENDADLIILNTCHIREKATNKVLSRLGRLGQLKKLNPKLKIAVAGCVAQAEAKRLLKAGRDIDIIVSPGKIDQIVDLYQDASDRPGVAVATGFYKDRKEMSAQNHDFDKPKAMLPGKNNISRFVNIAQGCNNFCTFCVVPFTRGPEVSKSPDTIFRETEAFIKHGSKEITLLGQNVNSYGSDLVEKGLLTTESSPFVDLLSSLCTIPGLERLRFTTSNPHDFTRPLAELFHNEPKLGKYLHLPVQCGSNDILKAMKRKVTVEEYLERVAWLRDKNPDFSLSTDLIVGFPGETEEDFQGTLDLVAKVRFSFVYAFKYSSRKNTAAARFPNQVPEAVMSERLARLNELQNKITSEQNEYEMGQVKRTMITYPSTKEKNAYYGRTEEFRLVKVNSHQDITGETLMVKITNAKLSALEGSPTH